MHFSLAMHVTTCVILCAFRLGLGHVKIVAKLEDLDGLKNHESIIGVADAVVFSRGSLGTCLEAEKVRGQTRSGPSLLGRKPHPYGAKTMTSKTEMQYPSIGVAEARHERSTPKEHCVCVPCCLPCLQVFLAQKMLLYAANNIGKPVFVTRVVDTMTGET